MIFSQKEKKKSKSPQNIFFMLEVKQMKQINWKAMMESFVSRLGKEAEILIFSFNFKLMYMEKCNTFLDNQ